VAFQARAYEAAMDRAGSFVAAGNLFWLNVLFRASPKVVSLSRSVGLVAKDFFRVPTEWPQELQLTIAVMPEYVKAKDLMKEFGQLKGEAEEVLQGWRSVALCTHMKFIVVQDTKDLLQRSISIREKVTSKYDAVARTTMQRILEVMAFKAVHEQTAGKLASSKVAELWKQAVEESSSNLTDRVSPDYVDVAIRVYEKVLMRGAVDLIVWTLDAIKDLLVTELANHQDFKGVPFTGKGNNKGLMDVIIFKQPLLHHFLYQTLPDCGMSSGDMDILRQFQTHDAFRKKCGGGKVKVDLQWQGFLSEAAVKAIGFLHIVIYGTKLDGNLKVSLKGTSNAGEMMEQVVGALSGGDKEQNEADALLNTVIPREKLESLDTKREELEQWVAHAKELQNRMVKLIVEPDTKTQLAQALEGTVCATKRSPEDRLLMWCDTKTAGESSTAPHQRYPVFKQDRMKKLLQGTLLAREEESPVTGEILVVADGGRAGLENNFNGCCVTSSGEPWETRNRVTLTLTYDEDSFVSRRSRVKGFLQLTEQLRIYTAKVLELPRVKRLHFSGTSKGLHIGPIQMLAWEDLWKVPKTSKSQIYGSAGKVLELLHSFGAKMVLDFTRTDEVFCMAAVARRTPYIGVVWTEAHKAELEKRIAVCIWNKMLDS
ncbi:unnamed protein product, partial [Effrenium voratum]